MQCTPIGRMADHFSDAMRRGPDYARSIGDQRRTDYVWKAGLDEVAHVICRDEDDTITHECISSLALGYCAELLQPQAERLEKLQARSELLILVIFKACHSIKPRKLFDDAILIPFHH